MHHFTVYSIITFSYSTPNAARAMRAAMNTVEAPRGAMDLCGTGGDGAGTFNVSSAASFVVAACGVPVAKHGNRAVSSRSGSADVMEALGVNINLTPEQIGRCVDEVGIGFMFAPAHHPAMKNVGPTRVELGTRTIFNLLGPLSTPALSTYLDRVGVTLAPGWRAEINLRAVGWMREAGFSATRVQPLVGPDSMVVGIK